MRRPYAIIYDALPQFCEQEVEAGIKAALEGQKRSVTLQAMIDAVGEHCQAAETARIASILQAAQETARKMPSMAEWRIQVGSKQQEAHRIEQEAVCLLIARVERIVDRVTAEAPVHMALHKADYARFECVAERYPDIGKYPPSDRYGHLELAKGPYNLTFSADIGHNDDTQLIRLDRVQTAMSNRGL